MEAGLREGLNRSSTGRGILCCGLKNWWWEEGCGDDMDMRESLADAWKRFGAYLGAERTEGTAQVIK